MKTWKKEINNKTHATITYQYTICESLFSLCSSQLKDIIERITKL